MTFRLAALLLLLAAPPLRAAAVSSATATLARLTIDEPEPARAAFLREALAAMLESPAARRAAAEYAVDGPTVTLRWAALDSSALSYAGVKTVISGLSAYTVYAGTGDIVSINERLLSASTPREIAQDLAHEILGHAYERAQADRAGVGYAYAVTRDNETAASLLGWLVAAELGLPQRDSLPFSLLDDPDAYYAERIYAGADYAAGLTAGELPLAREVYQRRAALARTRAAQWKREAMRAARQLRWIDHFIGDHDWPAGPFTLLAVELKHQRDEEAPRSAQLLKRIASVLSDLAKSLDDSPGDRLALAEAGKHPLMGRWDAQVRERSAALKKLLSAAGETKAPLQPRPEGQITQAQLLTMIERDLKYHSGVGADAPDPVDGPR